MTKNSLNFCSSFHQNFCSIFHQNIRDKTSNMCFMQISVKYAKKYALLIFDSSDAQIDFYFFQFKFIKTKMTRNAIIYFREEQKQFHNNKITNITRHADNKIIQLFFFYSVTKNINFFFDLRYCFQSLTFKQSFKILILTQVLKSFHITLIKTDTYHLLSLIIII